MNAKYGFTLIEISIVLVIIGLIVGGVLVGQDLIRAAAVRAQITQIEKYNTAVNTFRTRYNALPGDMDAATAAQFGFVPRGISGIFPGAGDGNGLIEGQFSAGSISNEGWVQGDGEPVIFWNDLTYANGMNINLVEGSFHPSGTIGAMGNPPQLVSPQGWLPEAKIGGSNYVYAWSMGGINILVFLLLGIYNIRVYIPRRACQSIKPIVLIAKSMMDCRNQAMCRRFI